MLTWKPFLLAVALLASGITADAKRVDNKAAVDGVGRSVERYNLAPKPSNKIFKSDATSDAAPNNYGMSSIVNRFNLFFSAPNSKKAGSPSTGGDVKQNDVIFAQKKQAIRNKVFFKDATPAADTNGSGSSSGSSSSGGMGAGGYVAIGLAAGCVVVGLAVGGFVLQKRNKNRKIIEVVDARDEEHNGPQISIVPHPKKAGVAAPVGSSTPLVSSSTPTPIPAAPTPAPTGRASITITARKK
ncbi:hypothetical protein HK101_011934 [Irineochytrium annulatum]|nr:hypothetical protein HK101_011934 [Irineochytrium annulatum]